MSENEPTNEGNTDGTKDNKPVAPDGKPLSDYDKALALVERREAATKEEEKLLDRKEKLAANSMLGGTTEAGQAPVEKKEETPHEYRVRINKELAEGKTEFGD